MKVFVSYRRTDHGIAGRITDHLIGQLGAGTIFFDADGIGSGTNYETRLREALDACDVLITVIGPSGWRLRTSRESGGSTIGRIGCGRR